MQPIDILRKTEAYLYEENMGATAIGTGLTASPGYAKNAQPILQKLQASQCTWQKT
jgi:aspartate ammonia-lyase